MHIRLILSLLILSLLSCNKVSTPQEQKTSVIDLKMNTFPVDGSVRAIELVDAETLWFAAGKGQYGYTQDGGNSWHIDSLQMGEKPLEFRAIDVTQEAVYLLSAGSPAFLFKSTDKGENWDIVYKEALPGTYYNSLKFWDEQEGIAVGDPTDACLSVIVTRDGGNTWEKLPCDKLPVSSEGEAGFAASNTNIAVHGEHVWLATGGAKARVIYSADRGRNWQSAETPIAQGGKMTGIFSVAFLNDKDGIIFGGDWENQEGREKCKAITADGGKTWNLINEGKGPSFRSCVQYVPNKEGKEIFAVGMPGISFSRDAGKNWEKLSEESYYTIRIADSGNDAWLAGRNKIMKMSW